MTNVLTATELRELHDLPHVKATRVAVGDDEDWQIADRLAVVHRDTGRLFGIHSTNYRLVHHEDGLASVLKAAGDTIGKLGPYEETIQLYDEGRRMRATLLFPESKFPVNGRGDYVNPTIDYFNSYDGAWAEKLWFGAYRVICSNGLVVGKQFLRERLVHVGAQPETFFANLADATKIYAEQTKVWKHWNKKRPSEHDVEVALAPYSDAHRREVTEQVEALKTVTYWTFFNVLTALITHQVESLNRRVYLENHLRRATASWPTR